MGRLVWPKMEYGKVWRDIIVGMSVCAIPVWVIPKDTANTKEAQDLIYQYKKAAREERMRYMTSDDMPNR